MRAAAIVGFRKSGKTTLVLDLVRAIKARGLTVSVAKHSHAGFDRGSDTDTGDALALADCVLGWSEAESFVAWPNEQDPADLLALAKTDVLLVEGAKTLCTLPRIILAADEAEAAELDPGLGLAVLAPGEAYDADALADAVLARGFLLPGLDCAACGHADCRAMAAAIVAGDAQPEDCAAARGEVAVTLDGRPLALNPFVGRMLRAALTGMLGELKGFGPGRIRIDMEQ